MKYLDQLQQDGSKGSVKDVLRPGREMVAAGYTMYGSSCNLVLSTGNGVDGFTLDEVSRSIIIHLGIVADTFSQVPRRVHPYPPSHQNPLSRQDLLIQRRKLFALPPPYQQLPQQHQVP